MFLLLVAAAVIVVALLISALFDGFGDSADKHKDDAKNRKAFAPAPTERSKRNHGFELEESGSEKNKRRLNGIIKRVKRKKHMFVYEFRGDRLITKVIEIDERDFSYPTPCEVEEVGVANISLAFKGCWIDYSLKDDIADYMAVPYSIIWVSPTGASETVASFTMRWENVFDKEAYEGMKDLVSGSAKDSGHYYLKTRGLMFNGEMVTGDYRETQRARAADPDKRSWMTPAFCQAMLGNMTGFLGRSKTS